MGHKFRDEDIDLDTEHVIVNGQRFTNADADALADELSGRDRSRANLQPGRKSLSGGSKHSPVVQFRVSEATLVKLKEIAAARQVSVSKLSRQVLDEWVSGQPG